MKRLTYILFLGLAAFALLQGCKKEKIEYSTFEEEITGENGYLCLDTFDLQVANYAEEISSSSRQAETKAGEERQFVKFDKYFPTWLTSAAGSGIIIAT